jgi:signal transduction histidine kinase
MAARRRVLPRLRRGDRYTRRLLRALLNLYQELRTPQPIDQLLEAVLDTALRCVPGVQRGSLLVVEHEQLVYRVARGYDLAKLRQTSFPAVIVRDEILGGARLVQIRDYANWDARNLTPAAFANLREHGHVEQIRRSLLAAIMVGGRFYGTLSLDNLRNCAPFPPEAEDLAMLFAEQAGALIEQALLLEQLRQTNTMLIEAEKLAALGRFIASIAHEINNPLTAVLGYADFLGSTDLRPEARAMLDQLRFGAERVRSIVRNLQLFARQQKNGPSEVNLNLLVEQTVTLKRADLSLDQIEVRTRLDPNLPLTWGDGGQLSQVLLNLIINAQHALHQTPPPRVIEVGTTSCPTPAEPLLKLWVTDNGPGIAAEVARQIFEPFFSTRPAGQGTGLGLSICQNIAHEHGGQLSFSAASSGGARFMLELPSRPAPAQPLPLPCAPEGGPPARPVGRMLLLVEDDPTVVGVVVRTLANDNTLIIANNGYEALQLASAQPFDVILCDLRMPGIDGLELYRRLYERAPARAARLIFMSGDTSSSAASEALAATGRPFLAKPFTPAELFAAVSQV